jgi:cell division septal protein FtsQ
VVRRLRGWSPSSAIRVDLPTPRSGALRLVTYAAAGACCVALAAGAAMSPLLRIRAVSWTGPIRLGESAYTPFETAVLGQPLLLLSEARVRRLLSLDNHVLEAQLHRHLPATLEVRLEPRRSLARLADGAAVDAKGRRLDPAHALPGLPLLVGFEWNAKGDRLTPAGLSLLRTVRPLCELPTLAPSEVRLEEDGDLQLVLADSGTRVRLDAARANLQLRKLRVYEEGLGSDPLPGSIDLRFANQIVVRDGGVRRASRSAR